MKTAKIILDQGLSTEFEFPVDRIYEDFKNKTFHASGIFIVGQDDIPDFSPMQGRQTITSIKLMDSGMVIPIIGTYNYIESFQTNYNAGSKEFIFNFDISNNAVEIEQAE